MFAIETKGISRSFGKVEAVRGVDLKIEAGDIYALIGPNGAGKTTLIKMLVGLLDPSQGLAKIGGIDIVKQPVEAKEKFGYVPDNPEVYGYLTGNEFLEMTGKLRGMKPAEINIRMTELEKIFSLGKITTQQMGSYSRGNRQKIAFLAALLTKPQVLIIDEPVAGLDPTSIEIFGKTITKFAADGGAVLLATHILSFGQKYATRVGVMSRGQLKKEYRVGKESLETIYDQETK